MGLGFKSSRHDREGTSPRSRRFGDPQIQPLGFPLSWRQGHTQGSVWHRSENTVTQEASCAGPRNHQFLNPPDSEITARGEVLASTFPALDLVAQLGVCYRKEFDYYVEL
jgi:hypothetical protein